MAIMPSAPYSTRNALIATNDAAELPFWANAAFSDSVSVATIDANGIYLMTYLCIDYSI
jgi:hypothetical protein